MFYEQSAYKGDTNDTDRTSTARFIWTESREKKADSEDYYHF